MRKLTFIVVIAMAGIIVATGCKKAEKTPEAPTAEKTAAPSSDIATPEQISTDLSATLCKRMIECTKDPEGKPIMNEEECITQTQTSLTQALQEKALSVTIDQLTHCTTLLANDTCANVMGIEPPKGCEFLK